MSHQVLTRTEGLPVALCACREAGVTANVIGMSGVGKSEICGQLFDALQQQLGKDDEGRWRFESIQNILSLKAPEEERGIPFPDRKTHTVDYFMPRETPFEGNSFTAEYGARFNDELDRAALPMRQAFIPQLTSRKVGSVPLKKGWWDVCAMNGRTVDETVDELQVALRLRMCHLYFHPTHTGLLSYAKANKWHPLALERMEELGPACIPECVGFEDLAVIQKKDGSVDEPSPRQLEMFSKLMYVVDKQPAYESVRLQLIQGVLGFKVACQMAVKIATRGRVPSFREINANADTAQIPAPSEQHFLGVVFPLFGTQAVQPDRALTYLNRCRLAGVHADLIRVGVNALSVTHPQVWSHAWALEAVA